MSFLLTEMVGTRVTNRQGLNLYALGAIVVVAYNYLLVKTYERTL